MKDAINQAMKIILNAGDARLSIMEALDAVNENNYQLANEKLKKSEEQIRIAHQVQTDFIQDSINKGVDEYSLLFSHAQDTLMTINSEINITKKLIKINQGIDKRFKLLEQKYED